MLIRRVVGLSMLPTLAEGAVVVGITKQPCVGDVVIAKVNKLEVIKRVKSIDDSGLFLVGDNPGLSTDSRAYGLIQESDVLAVIMVTFHTAFNVFRPRVVSGLWLGLIASTLMTMFVLILFYRIDTFIPELNYSLRGGYETTTNIGIAILLIEMLALSSLLH